MVSGNFPELHNGFCQVSRNGKGNRPKTKRAPLKNKRRPSVTKKKKNNPRAVVKRTIKFSFYGNLTLATQGKPWHFERLISRVRE